MDARPIHSQPPLTCSRSSWSRNNTPPGTAAVHSHEPQNPHSRMTTPNPYPRYSNPSPLFPESYPLTLIPYPLSPQPRSCNRGPWHFLPALTCSRSSCMHSPAGTKSRILSHALNDLSTDCVAHHRTSQHRAKQLSAAQYSKAQGRAAQGHGQRQGQATRHSDLSKPVPGSWKQCEHKWGLWHK